MIAKAPAKGRGAGENPAGRFEKLQYEPDLSALAPDDELPPLKTQYFNDTSKTIIAYNDSPDIPFDAGINPYRGCEHGCVYCFARPSHEFLGFSAGLDFESKIFVKMDAARLLRKELAAPKWQAQTIALSGNTDPYQPAERHFQITRQCLAVLAEFRNPVALISKNHLITRDIDLLTELASFRAAAVAVSITTLDNSLARKMEPRASLPKRRLAAISELAKADIPVGVMIAPIIPGLNDHEIPAILTAAVDAGASFSGYIILRLPYGLKDIFSDWLERHFPDRREKVLNRLRNMRDGKLNSPQFHQRMRGDGPFADQVRSMFQLTSQKLGLGDQRQRHQLSTAYFRHPNGTQLSLF